MLVAPNELSWLFAQDAPACHDLIGNDRSGNRKQRQDMRAYFGRQAQSRRGPRKAASPSRHAGLVEISQKENRKAISATLNRIRSFISRPLSHSPSVSRLQCVLA